MDKRPLNCCYSEMNPIAALFLPFDQICWTIITITSVKYLEIIKRLFWFVVKSNWIWFKQIDYW